MVKITFYKDRPAVAIACEEFTAVFLPEDGAKLVSFKTREEQELMAQASNETYLRLGLDSNYVECECSALDLFCQEPPEMDNPLLSLPNILLLPHCGAGTDEAFQKEGYVAAKNVADFWEGKCVYTILNPDYKNYKIER